MKLTELFLNRFLYKESQNMETKDSEYLSANATPSEPTPVSSGNTVYDINTNPQTINGGNITPGTIPTQTLDIANYGWTQTCNFTVASATTVTWSAGTFTSADGTSVYSIETGTTGTMSAKTYIYLDIAYSTTAYKISTNITDPIGVGKVLIAVAQNGTTSATYIPVQTTQIVSDNIIANSIQGNKIVAGSITATQISSSYVYAGTIDADNITAGTITGSTLQTSSSGQRVIIDGSNNDVRFYDADGVYQGRMVGSNTGTGLIFITGVNAVSLAVGSSNYFSASSSLGGNVSWRDLFPSSDDTYELGTVDNFWSDIWGTQIHCGGISMGGDLITSWSDFALLSGATFTGDVSVGSNDFRVGGYLYQNSGNNNAYIYSSGNTTTIRAGGGGTLTLNTTNKTAIVPTSEGFNALYCTESPEVWFMDFCEEKGELSPMFKEVTVAPYHYIKCEDGGYQVWGKRVGHDKKRFESKTIEEFEANEMFLNMNKPK